MDLVAAKPACPYTTEWKLIYQARDINDTEVTVYQPDDGTENGLQWFYTATCDRAQIYRENPHCTNCCRGIDQNRFTSNCIPKKSYVMAYVKRREQSQYEWDWIQINTGCSCAVSNRHH
ncbi:hypothetical protein FSP39_002570 [Pinctada imbricata]|uniref:Nerve growth factor-related domain-containing protein n=1 Tax=Pinctada imbricata TaxID=66713 RepID=A0AA89C6F4_PINIB|nr:hypothetical protein FSP39_002570 [Pinctada imbricata]